MNKKYLTRTIVYFVLALVVMPVLWFFSQNLVWLFIPQKVENIQKALEVVRYLHIGVGVLGLAFLGLGVWNLSELPTTYRSGGFSILRQGYHLVSLKGQTDPFLLIASVLLELYLHLFHGVISSFIVYFEYIIILAIHPTTWKRMGDFLLI